MSSQRERPVYIPRKRKAVHSNNSSTDPAASKRSGENDYQAKRQLQKQQQPRFHGAFTGGFSAGYFNTVGTKEGWKPSEVKKRDQRLEDFMDDEDHANWGGPTRLRDEYGTKSMASTESALKDLGDPSDDGISSPSHNKNRTPFLPIKSMLEISHQTVGPRLLRRLGWREGGSAIVPENTTPRLSGKALKPEDTTLENLAKVHLSRRKLRKIQLQSSRIKLPPPKLDKCGLGFQPYKHAPEFERYREKRKQQARDRASYNSRVNVYRLSDVAMKESDENEISNASRNVASAHDGNGGEYLSYETAEDFVGKRSSAGFAFRDDEDDAYDDESDAFNRGKNDGGSQLARPKGLRVGDEYNTEVYEHESSDDEALTNSRNSIFGAGRDKSAQPVASKNAKMNNKALSVGNMFASWAGTDQPSDGGETFIPRAALTSDGKPPLAGFVLGDSMDINKRRYHGPNIPRDYMIERHKFGEHESPYVLEAISNAVRLEQKEERRSQLRSQQQEEGQRQIQQKRDESSRPLSTNFSSLAEAMKNRFTSSTEDSSKKQKSTTETSKPLPAGLHMPAPVENKEDRSKDNTNPSKANSNVPKIMATRTVKSFFPNPLVCKRFCVPMPTNRKRNTSAISTDETRNNESLYFEREILGKATQLHQNEKGSIKMIKDAQELVPENQEETPKGIDRPSIENLRKIFQASSDESSSSEDDGSVEDSNRPQINLDQSSKNNSCSLQEIQKSRASPTRTKDQSEEKLEYRPSLAREVEVDNVSSRSSDSDDDESSKNISSRKQRKEKHRRKHSHHRKRHKRKDSRSKDDRDYYSDRSSSYEEDGEDERRKERRNREHKKRKRKKYSRHKSRKREKAEGR